MQTDTYPKIGTKVSYVRQKTTDGVTEIEQGTATILAIRLDPEKRLMAHLTAEKNVFNVDLACLNPTPEFVEKFKEITVQIQALSLEGNAKSGDVIAEYNQKIDSVYYAALGTPITVDE